MSTYVIGDLQGCFPALQQMLELIAYDPAQDRIILLGDLVNRGTNSLAVLRWARDNQISAVLGNHDLHLLAVAAGYEKHHKGDTLLPILDAPDKDELLDWLRHLPLAIYTSGYFLVHAGVLPQWSISQALSLAGEVESALRGDNYLDYLRTMYGNEPTQWHDNLTGKDRLRVITNGMTRLRFCSATGEMDFTAKAGLDSAPEGYYPWFHAPNRLSEGSPIVFGHWSALGLQVESDNIALDTGCLWGGQLSALRLEDRQVFQVECGGMAGIKRWH
ncbi:symmetrical bis(5'-nucleosyl)-tetraphosphatase [Sulfuriferula nivalis]|uniref:Bis(5'-nucleosyl)-tetraphosphatase, symmetrical n=1 Tax=Sulfuriferula nivalis TaxID=2675298 RepID=A0A809S4V6_9PROT|nr:symmetrical bis(5'-nucleosyl)-tetraphosphatase [Sulfuriferula nivalis]BBP02108.1 bis(5'-nucleosyl)-tetraphosphatase, symmetrical [Sulfuriferula nivalis]